MDNGWTGAKVISLGNERFPRKGSKMSIKMPQLVKAICTNCQTIDEVYWGQYGSEQSCFNCDCPPASFVKVVA
jgi:hypothetical protein